MGCIIICMRYQVPQFIEVEDKVFGPLTIKQFVYLAGSVGMAVVVWNLLPKFIAILVGGVIIGFGVALAFYRVNDRPFVDTVEAYIKYFFGQKLYLWKKIPKKVEKVGVEKKEEETTSYIPRLSDSKLKQISWSLDINEKVSNASAPRKESGQIKFKI